MSNNYGSCFTCVNKDCKRMTTNKVPCIDYIGLTDKQRVERAKGEIEAVMNQLQTDCDMKPDRALIFWSLQADGWKCEISMK